MRRYRPRDVALERTIAVARGDEPADLVVRGGRVLSVFTREWLDCDVADRRRRDRRARLVRRRRGDRRDGPLRRPGLHRRPHAPRVGQAPRRRVRAPRAPVRDDGRRRRSARDRERARRRRRPLAARCVGRSSARGVLHGAVVRAGLALRIASPPARARRSRVADAAPARARAGRDDELPWRRRRLANGAREARARRAPPTSTATPRGSSARSCRRTRQPGSARITRR